jgi:WD40 repeat protein
MYTLEGHDSYITELLYVKETRYLVSASKDKTLRIWDVSNEFDCIQTVRTGYHVQRMLFLGLYLPPLDQRSLIKGLL